MDLLRLLHVAIESTCHSATFVFSMDNGSKEAIASRLDNHSIIRSNTLLGSLRFPCLEVESCVIHEALCPQNTKSGSKKKDIPKFPPCSRLETSCRTLLTTWNLTVTSSDRDRYIVLIVSFTTLTINIS